MMAGAAAVLLAGCTLNVTEKRASRWATAWQADRLDVAIGPTLAARIDTTEMHEGTLRVESGALAKRVFSGRPDSPWRIEYAASQMTGYVDAGQGALLYAAIVRYSLTCDLTGPAIRAHFTAASRVTAMDSIVEAATKAVDDVLCQIGTQVQAAMPEQTTNR
jgi:hypothetical protein